MLNEEYPKQACELRDLYAEQDRTEYILCILPGGTRDGRGKK